jgi:dsDNA-binding SOS-regulon protein
VEARSTDGKRYEMAFALRQRKKRVMLQAPSGLVVSSDDDVRRRLARLLMLTVLGPLTAGFAVGETAPVKQLEMEQEGIKLIGQVEDVARDISYHADHLSSLPSGISKETHYHLPAWHQDTVDQMLDSAKALAANTNSAILNRNEAGAAPPMLKAEYRELISTIYEHSKALATTSDAAGDYAAANRQAVEAGLTVSAHR